MHDTSPEIAEKVCEMIRQKTPAERFAMGLSMYEFSRSLVIHAIKERNPNISLKDLRREFFLCFYRDDFSQEQIEKIILHLNQVEIIDEEKWR